jgi:hypothetical protein
MATRLPGVAIYRKGMLATLDQHIPATVLPHGPEALELIKP